MNINTTACVPKFYNIRQVAQDFQLWCHTKNYVTVQRKKPCLVNDILLSKCFSSKFNIESISTNISTKNVSLSHSNNVLQASCLNNYAHWLVWSVFWWGKIEGNRPKAFMFLPSFHYLPSFFTWSSFVCLPIFLSVCLSFWLSVCNILYQFCLICVINYDYHLNPYSPSKRKKNHLMCHVDSHWHNIGISISQL